MAKMDSPKAQQRLLQTVRATGSIMQGIKASGISEPTVRRYRNEHPEFDALIMDAQQFYEVQKSIKYGWEIMKEAKEFLQEEIRKGTCPHAIAYKIAYENNFEILG